MSEPTVGVFDYLEQDHRRLDEILLDAKDLLAAANLPEAGARFDEFAAGLNRHIDAEEQVLFPAFESLTGMTAGPTVVMRAEHVEIRRWMGVVKAAVQARDAAAVARAIEGLVGTLSVHNLKEEQILYPMADRAAGTDRGELVRQMQAI